MDGKEVVVWGGAARAGRRGRFVNHYNNGASYDPVKNSWRDVAPTGAPTARFLHTSVWAGNQMMVFGGTRQVAPDRHEYLGDGFLYDPTRKQLA